jgi:hypothetical protein
LEPKERGICSTSIVIAGGPSERHNLEVLEGHLDSMGWRAEVNYLPSTIYSLSGCRLGWDGIRLSRFCLSAYALQDYVERWEMNGVHREETLDEFGMSTGEFVQGRLFLVVLTGSGFGSGRYVALLNLCLNCFGAVSSSGRASDF